MPNSSNKSQTILPFTVPRLDKWAKAGGGEPRKPIIYRDASTPGLIYLVRAKRQASFAFESKLNRKTIRIVFDASVIKNLGAAQTEALRLKTLISQGIDPRVAKAKAIEAQEAERVAIKSKASEAKLAEKRATVPMRSIWDDYIQHNRDGWGERHFRDHLNLAQAGGEKKTRGTGLTKPGVLASVLDVPASALNATRLKLWLQEESQTRENSVRQGFEALRACWRWASEHEVYKQLISSPTLFETPDLLKAKPKRKAADAKDVLERSHLREWFEAVGRLDCPEIRVLLQVLLLTGARRNELLGLRWQDIDIRTPANTWIHDKVEETGRYIPLGPYTLWLIHSLPKRNWLDDQGRGHETPWVFASAEVDNRPIHHDSPGAAHRRALIKAGLPHISVHALRRSYATLSEWIEMPAGVCAQIMGHRPSATAERHYRKRPIELLAQWNDRFEAWILEQGGVEFDSQKLKGNLRVIK